jgi:hypothetical protein
MGRRGTKYYEGGLYNAGKENLTLVTFMKAILI